MSSFSDIITYIWLFPVTSQILLPVGLLVVWLIFRSTKKIFRSKDIATD